MKKTWVVAIAVVVIALLCGGFYWFNQKYGGNSTEKELTKVQKIITKDLEKDYPETPREVIKLYNRIITCYYGEEYTEEEFVQLAEQALCLFDEELLEINPRDTYIASVQQDVNEYKDRKKTISQSSVCDTAEVRYVTDNQDKIAYVTASYFIKEGNSYSKTYQEYVLRKDENGKWKILTFYQIDGPSDDAE